jgi:16S rRNA (guanine966-N2)-methyltransferase
MTASCRKSLFDMLGGRCERAAAVDLYCGTGTLGLEALSRGAARCAFAELRGEALRRLRRNIEALGAAERCTVWRGDVLARLGGWLSAFDQAVDLAFVDPPFDQVRRWSWAAVAARLFAPLADALAGDGRAVLRVPAGVDVPEAVGGLAVRRRKEYADMVLVFLGPRGEGE